MYRLREMPRGALSGERRGPRFAFLVDRGPATPVRVDNSAKGSARRALSLPRDRSSTPPAKSLLHWTRGGIHFVAVESATGGGIG